MLRIKLRQMRNEEKVWEVDMGITIDELMLDVENSILEEIEVIAPITGLYVESFTTSNPKERFSVMVLLEPSKKVLRFSIDMMECPLYLATLPLSCFPVDDYSDHFYDEASGMFVPLEE